MKWDSKRFARFPQYGTGEGTNRSNKTADLSPNVSAVTLNVNGLHTPVRRQRLAEGIKSHNPTARRPPCAETPSTHSDVGRLEVEGWDEVCPVNVHF